MCNKSSPLQEETTRKKRFDLKSDKSVFLEADCDTEAESETELSSIVQSTQNISTNMAAKMSPDELQELVKAIADIIKEQLLSEVRTELHNIFFKREGTYRRRDKDVEGRE
jgi:hypothetical protein